MDSGISSESLCFDLGVFDSSVVHVCCCCFEVSVWSTGTDVPNCVSTSAFCFSCDSWVVVSGGSHVSVFSWCITTWVGSGSKRWLVVCVFDV